MFEKLKKINIKGGCFEEETALEMFKNDPVSVIYGRIGSGIALQLEIMPLS